MTKIELNAHRWRKLLAMIHAGDLALSKDTEWDRWGYATKTEYFDGYFDVAKEVDAMTDNIIKIMEESYENDFTTPKPD